MHLNVSRAEALCFAIELPQIVVNIFTTCSIPTHSILSKDTVSGKTRVIVCAPMFADGCNAKRRDLTRVTATQMNCVSNRKEVVGKQDHRQKMQC
jgi:hypothetical protein